MITLKVIEFVRPNGRQVEHALSVADSYKDKVDAIEKAGLRFTLEHLGDGGVASVTIEKPGAGDVMCELTESDNWELGIDTLLRDYAPEILTEWEKEMEG